VQLEYPDTLDLRGFRAGFVHEFLYELCYHLTFSFCPHLTPNVKIGELNNIVKINLASGVIFFSGSLTIVVADDDNDHRMFDPSYRVPRQYLIPASFLDAVRPPFMGIPCR
jgi:hypothetical protein